jgi:hypothetical protein
MIGGRRPPQRMNARGLGRQHWGAATWASVPAPWTDASALLIPTGSVHRIITDSSGTVIHSWEDCFGQSGGSGPYARLGAVPIRPVAVAGARLTTCAGTRRVILRLSGPLAGRDTNARSAPWRAAKLLLTHRECVRRTSAGSGDMAIPMPGDVLMGRHHKQCTIVIASPIDSGETLSGVGTTSLARFADSAAGRFTPTTSNRSRSTLSCASTSLMVARSVCRVTARPRRGARVSGGLKPHSGVPT